MMKKLLVCVTVVGLVVSVCYLLCKTKKEDNISTKPMEEKNNSELKIKNETMVEEQDAIQELYVAKEKSTQSVCERHTEAAKIMVDALANITEDVELIEPGVESIDTAIDIKDVEIINELDSLSDELDKLIK